MAAAAHGIPMLGLGTFTVTGDIGVPAMLDGFELGYRHIDTAQGYGNEIGVGQAIARSGLKRGEIFVTTKVDRRNLGRSRLGPSLRESRECLGVDQIDLALIHWPVGVTGPPLPEYMEALARAKADGLVRQIGVSNFTCKLLDDAIDVVGGGEIINNQVEVHPYLQNRTLRQHAARLGVSITAYMPIAGGRVMTDPVLTAIAASHAATPAQVALAWLMQEGVIVIPSSKKRAHLQSNLKAAELTITDAEVAAIQNLDRGLRLINGSFAPDWD
jgi:2,5-diketo-D-gluconate reductase B